MSKTYSYELKNVSDTEPVLSAVKELKSVIEASAIDGVLSYTLEDGADEYEVLIAAVNAAYSVGGEVIVDGESPASDYDYDYRAEDESSVKNADNEVIDGDNEIENGFEDDLAEEIENEEDRIVSQKGKAVTRRVTRAVELGAALVALVVSLFLKPSETTAMSFKNILMILSFAVSAYEILYSAVTDLFTKKWLSENVYISVAFVLAALVNQLLPITVLALIFAVAKEIENIVGERDALRTDEAFYTGSFSVKLSSGEKKSVKDLEVGDEMVLERYDVLPCDAVISTAAKFDCYRTEGVPEREYAVGERVLAGSVLLSESATAVAEKTNAESRLSLERSEFENKIAEYGKTGKIMKFLSPCVIAAAVLFVFVASAFYNGTYAQGLAFYAPIGLFFVFCSFIGYLIERIAVCVKGAAILLRSCSVDVRSLSDIKTLAKANSFVFDAAALTERGEIKEDALGALKELLNGGARNITTDFSGSALDGAVAEKIDFVDKPFKGERKLTVGSLKDVSLDDSGKICVKNGEISFVPLAYKIAKRALLAERAAKIASFVLYAASVTLAIVLGWNNILFAALPAAFSLVAAGVCSLVSAAAKK